jgi:DNA-binding transcriptional LysR family regulator
MDIASLETFLMVAKQHSFSLTADILYLTQPAISKRISALENELKCQLFDRIKKKIILTEAGRLFLPHAKNMIIELQAGKNSLTARKGIISGELMMLTSHHIGLHHLPPVLKHYVNQYPQVNLRLDFMNSESACLAVENAEVEMAVITLPNRPKPCLHVIKIWSDPMIISVHNDHPILTTLTKNSNTLSHTHLLKLSQYPAILPEQGTYTRELLNQYFMKQNIKLQVKLTNNYLQTIKMMVSIGLGWSILPHTLIDNTLSSINIVEFTPCRSLGIVTHKNRTLSAAAKQMVRLLKQVKETRALNNPHSI